MQETIQTEHLAYTYPGVEDTPGVAVFKDLNLTIENGSFVAISHRGADIHGNPPVDTTCSVTYQPL